MYMHTILLRLKKKGSVKPNVNNILDNRTKTDKIKTIQTVFYNFTLIFECNSKNIY